jgi:N-acetylmuramoyl-L-alanine amidase
MKVNSDFFLEPVKRDLISGGSAMPIRRVLVIHFTSGATAKSSIESMRDRRLSAHLVIDRDGTIYQCRAFNQTCGHAGVSRWQDPKTKVKYTGINSCGIGIELANGGDEAHLIAKYGQGEPVKAKHRNESTVKTWEPFPKAQFDACVAVSKVLVKHFKLDDVTGHDCIAPERKTDPGPAFNMLALREACGFSGLPVVHWLKNF